MGISREEALDCFRSDDLIGIGMEADAVRRRLHPEGVVSYAIEGWVNCSGAVDGGVGEVIFDEIAPTIARGGTGVRLTGVPSMESGSGGIEWCERLVEGIRRRFPSVWVEGFSAAEVMAIARGGGIGLRETVARLRDAGLDAIAGGDAGVEMGEWVEVHRTAHEAGMRTTAAMVLGADEAGAGETAARRVERLEHVRRLQEETGGFTAFVPLSEGGLEGPTAVEYLKMLAISRMFLDNIESIEAGAARGLKVLQAALRFGGNDAGAVRAEHGGGAKGPTEEDIRRVIRGAGFKPVQRDAAYRTMYLV